MDAKLSRQIMAWLSIGAFVGALAMIGAITLVWQFV